MTDRPICAAFMALALLAKHDKLDADPEAGLWHRKVGGWEIWANRGGNPQTRSPNEPEISPCSVYLEWMGWPAGLIYPYGGIIAAGEGANEDSFIAAIEAEIGKKVTE